MAELRIRAVWLKDPDLRRVMSCLSEDGGTARIAGGAVRNALLKKPISDIDIATPHLPNEVMRRAKAAGLGVHPTGLDHGTVTLTSNGKAFEVTTLRRDVQTDGRRAVVAFTRDWSEDAARRDFTINAMYCDLSGKIYSYTTGYKDIRIPRVKFVGSAGTRIREDYLRILRFFRFHAQYGERPLDRTGLAACKSLRKGIRKLSAERIRQELLKLLAAPKAIPTLKLMARDGILSEILPYTEQWRALERLPYDPILRLSLLARQTATLQSTLKLSNAEAKRLAAIASMPRVSPDLRPEERRRILYQLGPGTWRDAVHVAFARSKTPKMDRRWTTLLRLPDTWIIPQFPVSGTDLKAIGLAPGPELGETLRLLEDWWIASDFTWTKKQLMTKARTSP